MESSARAKSLRPADLERLLDAEVLVYRGLADLGKKYQAALLSADRETIEVLTLEAEILAEQLTWLEESRSAQDRVPSAKDSTRVAELYKEVKDAAAELVRQTAVSAVILERMNESVSLREATLASLSGCSYGSDGHCPPFAGRGVSLSAEV